MWECRVRAFGMVLLGCWGLLLSACSGEEKGCDPECGEGLICVQEERWLCRLEEAGIARLLFPEDNAQSAESELPLSCAVEGPQVREVRFHISPPEPLLPIKLIAALSEGVWQASYRQAHGYVMEGRHDIRCEAQLGPAGHGNVLRSENHSLQVDRSPPLIEVDPPARWLRSSDTFELAARIVDGPREPIIESSEPVGVDPDSVLLTLGEYTTLQPTSVNGDEFLFSVALGPLFSADAERTLVWSLEAADKLGNHSSSKGQVSVTSNPPAPVLPTELLMGWHRRSDTVLSLPVSVEFSQHGAPLKSPPQLSTQSGQVVAAARKEGEGWVLPVVTEELIPENEEGMVPLLFRVEDQAGLESTSEFELKIDGKPPVVQPMSEPVWVARGIPSELLLQVTDGGSGLRTDSFAVELGPDSWQPVDAPTGTGVLPPAPLPPLSFHFSSPRSSQQAARRISPDGLQRRKKIRSQGETTEQPSLRGRSQSLGPDGSQHPDRSGLNLRASRNLKLEQPLANRLGQTRAAGKGGWPLFLGKNDGFLRKRKANRRLLHSKPPPNPAESPFLLSIHCVGEGVDLFRCVVPSDSAPEAVEGYFQLQLHFEDHTGNSDTASITLAVDDLPPQISLILPEGSMATGNDGPALWFSETEDVLLSVEARDEGSQLSGVLLEQESGDVDCWWIEADLWSCPVDVSSPGDSSFELQIGIRAVDRVANETRRIHRIGVDREAPELRVNEPIAWVGAGHPDFLIVEASDVHSGLEQVQLSMEGGVSDCLPGEQDSHPEPHEPEGLLGPQDSGGNDHPHGPAFWLCPLPLFPPGLSEELPFVLRAEDRVGLVSELAGNLPVDTLAPEFFADTSEYLPRQQQVAFALQVVDSGAGVDPEGVRFEGPGGSSGSCEWMGAETFQCLLDTTAGAEGQNSSLEFIFHAADVLGNEDQVSLTLLVDDEGPSVSLVSPAEEWLGYGNETFIVRIEDTGAGLPPLEEATELRPVGAGAFNQDPFSSYTLGGASIYFNVSASKFLPAGRTVPAFPLELSVVDRLGNRTVHRIHRSFDGETPEVDLDAFPYPPTGAFKRISDAVEITATLSDSGRDLQGTAVKGSGVSAVNALMLYTGRDGYSEQRYATDLGGERFRWLFDPKEPPFPHVDGEVELRFEVRDRVGNKSTLSRPLMLTRKLWEVELEPGAYTMFGAAFAEGVLVHPVIGMHGSELVALDASSGEILWRIELLEQGLFEAQHVAIGVDHVYAIRIVNGESRLSAIRLHSPKGNPQVDWEVTTPCSSLSFALVNWQWPGQAAQKETVLIPCDEGIFGAYLNDSGTGMLVPISTDKTSVLSVNTAGMWAADQKGFRLLRYHPITNTLTQTQLDGQGSLGFALRFNSALTNAAGHLMEWSSTGQLIEKFSMWDQGGFPLASPVIDHHDHVWWTPPAAALKRYWPGYQIQSEVPLPEIVHPITGITVAYDQSVYLAAEGLFMAISPLGELAWTYKFETTESPIYSAPLLACDGRLFFGSNDGRVIALAGDSPGLADGWPRPNRDNRNSNSALGPLRYGEECWD